MILWIPQIDRIFGAGPPLPCDEADIRERKKYCSKWDGRCGIVLNIFKRSIAQPIKDTLRRQYVDLVTPSRDVIHGALLAFRVTAILGFQCCTSATYGMKLMGELIEERIGWNDPLVVYTDE